ncbi:MAG: signal recognition particle-docking protein FtsY [Bdellovibrionales bacterium]
MELSQDLLVLLGGLAIGAGTLASAAYYFARYMINTEHEVEASAEELGAPPAPTEAAPRRPELELVPPLGTAPPPSIGPEPSVPVLEPEAEAETEAEAEAEGEVTPVITPAAPSAPAPVLAPVPELAPAPLIEKPSLNKALRSTRESFWGRIQRGLIGGGEMSPDHIEVIEEILYTSDLGPTTVTRLMDSVEDQLSRKEKRSLDTVKSSLKSEVESILTSVPRMGHSPFEDFEVRPKPQIWMIVGVNGVGKTTTIGKLAYLAVQRGARVLVAAGDTFRAAAQSQLRVWTERAQVEIFAPEAVKDPGAVAFDAVQMARSRGYDLVLIDTAGRLHTQANLMEELRKVKRVIQKLDPEAPHETLIVLDANSGQNALVQAQKFHETLQLTGAVFTKMDGTAKGGVVLGLASQLQIPTVFLGIGESMDALTGFRPDEYTEALFESRG